MPQKSKLQRLIKNPLDFFRERGGFVIEQEHGWINYYVNSNGTAYLENMFIYPEFRQSQNGTYLLTIFEIELKEIRGIDLYYTSINRKFGDVEKTMQICLKRGFKFHSSNDECIILKKGI